MHTTAVKRVLAWICIAALDGISLSAASFRQAGKILAFAARYGWCRTSRFLEGLRHGDMYWSVEISDSLSSTFFETGRSIHSIVSNRSSHVAKPVPQACKDKRMLHRPERTDSPQNRAPACGLCLCRSAAISPRQT